MTGLPLGHVAGIPLEETIASAGPALLAAFAAAVATLRGRASQYARIGGPRKTVPSGAVQETRKRRPER